MGRVGSKKSSPDRERSAVSAIVLTREGDAVPLPMESAGTLGNPRTPSSKLGPPATLVAGKNPRTAFPIRKAPLPEATTGCPAATTPALSVDVAEKLETIGLMTTNVIHDLGNFLTVILGSIDRGLRRMPIDHLAVQPLGVARKSALHAVGAVRLLLSHLRQQPTDPRILDLNAYLTGNCEILQCMMGRQPKVVLRLSRAPLWLKMDPSDLICVLLNLTANARDAISRGGLFTIETTGAKVPDECGCVGKNWHPESAVVITARDSGRGMDPVTLARAFEPFFTSKCKSRGMGLGLASVYRIVRQYGGLICIHSQVGSGSAVRIRIPAAAPPV